jgi:hypothetical protein
VREAENIGANLIVMSCHSYGWPDWILHGSDAEGVLRRAPCPVLIAKELNQTRISPILNSTLQFLDHLPGFVHFPSVF